LDVAQKQLFKNEFLSNTLQGREITHFFEKSKFLDLLNFLVEKEEFLKPFLPARPTRVSIDQCVKVIKEAIQTIDPFLRTEVITCGITQERPVYPVKSQCGHIFEETALKELFQRNKELLQSTECPACRSKIQKEKVVKLKPNSIITFSRYEENDFKVEISNGAFSTVLEYFNNEEYQNALTTLDACLQYSKDLVHYSKLPSCMKSWVNPKKQP